jgi:hypothetical protein
MVNKFMKKSSTSLVIKEMQIQATLKFHLSSVGMAIIKSTINNKVWPGCGGGWGKGTLIHCW